MIPGSILDFALKHWKALLAALVAAALLIALLVTRSTLAETKALYEAEIAAHATEKANHAVTRASVVTLRTALDAKNAESEARAKAFEDAKRQAAADVAAADAKWRSTADQVAKLKAIAARPGNCPVPKDLMEGLNGL